MHSIHVFGDCPPPGLSTMATLPYIPGAAQPAGACCAAHAVLTSSHTFTASSRSSSLTGMPCRMQEWGSEQARCWAVQARTRSACSQPALSLQWRRGQPLPRLQATRPPTCWSAGLHSSPRKSAVGRWRDWREEGGLFGGSGRSSGMWHVLMCRQHQQWRRKHARQGHSISHRPQSRRTS